MDVAIRIEPYDSDVVQYLVQSMADDLAKYYGPASYPPQDPTRWAPPLGTVLVAYVQGNPAALGAIIAFDAESAEVKRMFTCEEYRRQGIAGILLAALEEQARRLGYRRLVLETGILQVDAQSLYKAHGFSRVPCWPPHDLDPTSLCFSRDLV